MPTTRKRALPFSYTIAAYPDSLGSNLVPGSCSTSNGGEFKELSPVDTTSPSSKSGDTFDRRVYIVVSERRLSVGQGATPEATLRNARMSSADANSN